jgi:hypothetical protein
MSDEKVKKSEIVKSQADYKGNSHFDLVEVVIIKDGSFYTKGDKDKVHPSLAAILKAKGLIGDYEKNVVKRDSSTPMLTDLESQKVQDGEKEL